LLKVYITDLVPSKIACSQDTALLGVTRCRINKVWN